MMEFRNLSIFDYFTVQYHENPALLAQKLSSVMAVSERGTLCFSDQMDAQCEYVREPSGFFIAQILRVQHGPNPDNIFHFRVTELASDGRPLRMLLAMPPYVQPSEASYDFRSIELIDCPALHERARGYPVRFDGKVPKSVELLLDVQPDPMVRMLSHAWKGVLCKKGGWYSVWVNVNGAVSAVMPNGRQLGLKPDEFQVIEWH